MATVLLVGLNDQTVHMVSSFDGDLFGYVNDASTTEIANIKCYSAPGDWLISIDLVVPLLDTHVPDTWNGVMANCVMLEQELLKLSKSDVSATDGSFCWIETIDPEDAPADLQTLYAQLQGAHGKVHHLYQAASLQPAPLLAADAHYRAVLHDPNLVSDPWFLELLASQAATLAGCTYALTNHGENFIKLLGDRALGQQMMASLRSRDYGSLYEPKHAAFLAFGEKLCLRPHAVTKGDVDHLKTTGATDTEILEAVQATACFAYWTRYINGLGISMGDETIGRQDLADV
jgi:uncharacterized peroxidase-related enzyme